MAQYRELFHSGEYSDCEQACRAELAADSSEQDVWVTLCLSLIGQERWSDAIDCCHEALEALTPPRNNESVFYQLMGDAATGAGNVFKAEESYLKASELAPGRAVAHYALARFYFDSNQFEPCSSALNRLFSIGPSIDDRLYAKALYMYSRLPVENTAAGFFANYPTLKPRVDDPAFFYGMGNLLVRDQQYELALRFFTTANNLKRNFDPYNFIVDLQVIKEQHQSLGEFDPDFGHALSDMYPTPVFIIGMPRTGSSILEQMLGAHSQVKPLGESGYLLESIRKEIEVSYEPQGTKLLMAKIRDKEFCEKVRDNFLELVDGGGYSVVIDKSLANYHFIPLIRVAFPNAVIVHTKREKAPCIWSSFRTFFTQGVRYSETLVELSRYYDALMELLEDWAQRTPIVEVKYETMIENPERQVRGILEHLELELEAACLEPSTQERVVITASQVQVTKPLYKEANKDFEPFRELVMAQLERIEG